MFRKLNYLDSKNAGRMGQKPLEFINLFNNFEKE